MKDRLIPATAALGLCLALSLSERESIEKLQTIFPPSRASAPALQSQRVLTGKQIVRNLETRMPTSQEELEAGFTESAKTLQTLVSNNGREFQLITDENGYSSLRYVFEDQLVVLSLPESEDIDQSKACNLLFKVILINPRDGSMVRTLERKIFSADNWEDMVSIMSTDMPSE